MPVTFGTPVVSTSTSIDENVSATINVTGLIAKQPVIVIVHDNGGGSNPSFFATATASDTMGNTYTQVASCIANVISGQGIMRILVGTGGSGGSGTITVNPIATNASASKYFALAIPCIGASLEQGSAIVDASLTTSGGSNTNPQVSGPITIGALGEGVIAICWNYDTSYALSAPGGVWTVAYTHSDNFLLCTTSNPSLGSLSASFTRPGTGEVWYNAMIAFKQINSAGMMMAA
jgi:hypothetical protein